jgi:uridine kinase
MIPLDCFYKECTDEQMQDIGNVNFDHPQIFDWELLKQTLTFLREGKDVVLPDYDYMTCKRKETGLFIKWAPLVIFEGIFALLDREINSKFLDFKIFVLTDDDVRLARRIKRDIVERGRKVEGVLKSYHKYVKPAHVEFVRPTMKYADLIVPRGRPMESARNKIAIDFIV